MLVKASTEDLEKEKEVRIRYCVFTVSTHGYPRVLQEFVNVIIPLKRPRHPNFVSLIGVTMDPFQVVVERMPDRDLVGYLEEHPEANRISLVSPLRFIAFD